MKKDKTVNSRGARVIRVIEVVTLEGSGKSEEDLSREVKRYYSFDGRLLAEFDPIIELSKKEGD